MNRRERRKKQSQTKRRGAKSLPNDLDRLNKAISHQQAGRFEKADAIYQELLRANPHNLDALHLSGAIALQTGRYEEALELIGSALLESAGIALYHRNMALTLEELYRGDDALTHFVKAVELEPTNSENHLALASAYDRGEFHNQAAECFQRAIELGARDGNIHTSLAIALTKCNDTRGAVQNFEIALELAPRDAFAYANLGRFHADNDNPEAAEPLLRRALQIEPDLYEAVIELGALLGSTYRAKEALPLLEHACTLNPGSVRARSEHASALRIAGHLHQAHDAFVDILKENPQDHKAYLNLGLTLAHMNKFEESIRAYGKAIAIKPDYDDAYSNRSIMRLALGDFTNGWEDYQFRDSVGEMSKHFHRDVLPADLSEKRIALYRDQGLGDEIFFLRFARQIKDRGAWIAYDPDPKIASMIERLDFIDYLMRDVWPAEGYDLRISLGDLPLILSANDVGDLPPPLDIPVLAERENEIIEYFRTSALHRMHLARGRSAPGYVVQIVTAEGNGADIAPA